MDNNIFISTLEEYQDALVKLADRLVHNKEDAKDIVQEVVCQCLFSPKVLKFNQWELKAYFFKSVNNKCLNVLRHRHVVNKQVKDWSYSQNSHYSLESNQQYGLVAVEVMINLIPQRRPREACRMLFLEELSIKEIAKRMKVSYCTVKEFRATGLKTLRKIYLAAKFKERFTCSSFDAEEVVGDLTIDLVLNSMTDIRCQNICRLFFVKGLSMEQVVTLRNRTRYDRVSVDEMKGYREKGLESMKKTVAELRFSCEQLFS
jgi:RNA polymerase sigma-19 factor, ECF subfamily